MRCRIYVDPKFKKLMRQMAAEEDTDIISLTRRMAQKEQPLIPWQRIQPKKNEKKKLFSF